MVVRNRRLAELAIFVALTLLHTWPLASDPGRLSRLDNNDTAFNTWVVAWVQHQLPRNPLSLFDAPIFYPERDALAFSEHLVVPSIIGLPFHWAGASPVLVYNLLVMIGFVLSGIAMCRLMTRWTGCFAAGVISGLLFSFNAHVLTRFAHLQAMHVEFIPIVLYAFDRLLEERRPKHAVLLALAFVLQALCSNYLMVMSAFALCAALLVRREPWAEPRQVWPLLAAAGMGAGVLLLPFLIPYYRLNQEHGFVRTIDEVQMYSASWRDYLSTVGRVHYNLWSYQFAQNRTALFPGFTAVVLASIAIASGVAWRDRRARMFLAIAALGVLLSLGANLPGYAWIQQLPVLQGIRAVARWGYLALIAAAVLAGFGVARLAARWSTRTWWPALVVALAGAVTIEAMRTPLSLVPFTGIPPVHSRLRDAAVRAVVYYPLYPDSAFHMNAPYLLYQTRHWKPIVNGYSSFAPETFYARVRRFRHFPAPEVIAEMRALGISHVMLEHKTREPVFGKQALVELRAHPDLEFVLDQDGWAMFRIK